MEAHPKTPASTVVQGYERPKLTVLGDFASLTQGNAHGKPDKSGTSG